MAADGVLRVDDHEYELPGVPSAEGMEGLRIGSLLKDTGKVTYDPGFANTANASSAVTYIDGDEGILRYRGYPIEQLAEKSTFVEVSYLLIYGELPTQTQLDEFDARLRRHTIVHEDLRRFFQAFPLDAHPMPMVSAAINAMSTFYQDSLSVFDEEQIDLSTARLLAKMPTIAALAHRKNQGLPVVHPDNSLGLVENFLRVNFGFPSEPYEVDPLKAKALDQLFILHADHEQNCSTSTVRLVGSSQANLYQSIAAGINALSGPLHGGANSAVLEMLEGIKDSDDGAKKYMERVKNKEKGVRLMGFGHRVYKNGDSRVPTMRQAFESMVEVTGDTQLLDLYNAFEEDFVGRKGIYPNLDYPSGPAYHLMGFDTEQFTPIFVMARITGWTAHIMEQQAANALIRPLSAYDGQEQREVPADRG